MIQAFPVASKSLGFGESGESNFCEPEDAWNDQLRLWERSSGVTSNVVIGEFNVARHGT